MEGAGKTPRRSSRLKRSLQDTESQTSPLFEGTTKKKPTKQISLVNISSSFHGDDCGHTKHENGEEKLQDDKEMEQDKEIEHDKLNDSDDIVVLKETVNKLASSVNFLTQAFFANKATQNEVNLFMSAERYQKTEDILKKFYSSPEEGKKTPGPAAAGGLVKKLFSPSEMRTVGKQVISPNSVPHPFNYDANALAMSPSDRLQAIYIPSWLQAMFGVGSTAKLCYTEAAVACYLFMKVRRGSAESEEVLIKPIIEIADGKRSTLQCLFPKATIHADIIDLYVSMLTHRERGIISTPCCWFLPTLFSQYILSWTTNPTSMISFYQKSCMGYVDFVTKVFVPVHDNGHWYLLVINFAKKEIVYLDSFPQADRMEERMTNAKLIALFMEIMFRDPSFYDFELTEKPRVSQFRVVVPSGLPVQKADSNDCGVWVTSWMNMMGTKNYQIQVDGGTRLTVALDIAISHSNMNQSTLLKKALDYYQDLVRDAIRKQKK